jgi:hypothetical protein
MKLSVRYQAGGESGWGKIVNISSKGALFTTDRALALHACVELYVRWPVLLHNSVQLRLIAAGTIIRVEPGRAALAIEKYEFRTCVPSFFQRSQPWQLPGRAAPAPQSPIESRTLLQRHPAKLAGIAGQMSKNRRQRNVEENDARWERVFQEKFADPEYYSFRLLTQSSPRLTL